MILMLQSFLFKLLLDLLTVHLEVRIHGVLMRNHLLNLFLSPLSWVAHLPPMMHCRVLARVLYLRQVDLALNACGLLNHGHRQRPRKGVVALALDGEFHVIDVDGFLSSVVFVDLGFLQDFHNVVVHELKHLVYHVLLVVLDA